MTSQKAELIYVGDPMCSWCYGFETQLSQITNELKGEVSLELVNGGLRPYYDATMLSMKDFLSQHWLEVHEATGQEFSYGILDRADLAYDTEPPARAAVCVRKLAPAQEMTFFKAIQRAFYLENKNMNLKESYHGILSDLGIDLTSFDELFSSQEMKELVKRDFQRAQDLGVRSFPTLLLRKGEEVHLIAQGYVEAGKAIQQVRGLLSPTKN